VGKYARAGAATGAVAGTAVTPGVGTVVGGVAGYALGGLFDSENYGAVQQDWSQVVHGRGLQDESRAGQSQLAEALWRRQQGLEPSLAQMQYQQSRQQNLQDTASMAASSRGDAFGQALAHRQAADVAATTGQQYASQGAMLRAQEQMQTEGQLAGVYDAQRSGDLQYTQQEAQLQVEQAKWQADMINAQREADSKKDAGLLGAVGTAGAALIPSDKRIKTAVKPGDDAAERFLEALTAYRYRYKDDDSTEHLGVMAQDMEQSALGKEAVRETSGGKAIHKSDAMGAMLAALANLHERVQKVESK
jgi:hypothetical protein